MELVADNSNVINAWITDGETEQPVNDCTDLKATLKTLAGADADPHLKDLSLSYVSASSGKYRGISQSLDTVTPGSYKLIVDGTSQGRILHRELDCTVVA